MPVRRLMLLIPFKLRMRVLQSVERRIITRLPRERRLPALRRITPIADGAPAPGHSPAAVRKHNLDRVASALEAVGVAYLRIPVAAAGRTAVAVEAGDREAVLAVLAGWDRLGGAEIKVELPRGARRRADATVLSVCWPATAGDLRLGHEYACDIEFWTTRGDTFVAPRPNPIADEVPADEPAVRVPEAVFGAFADARDTSTYPTRPVFATVPPERVRFPVDVVYTYLDPRIRLH